MAWRGLDAWRAEAATLDLGDGLQARGVQIAAEYRLDYELETDAGLLTRALALTASGDDGERSVRLERLEDGTWTANGEPQPDVEGALDCDLAFSPLTNFMPAKRLGDRPVEHVMAWVSVPDLGVLRSEQRYEPIDEHRVRYVGLGTDFLAELELDDDGFVVRYPGLAERVAG